MANIFLTLQTIAREALPRLIENLVFPNLCYRDFSEAYSDLGDTIQVRKPVSLEAKEFDESTGISYQDMKEDSVLSSWTSWRPSMQRRLRSKPP